MIHYQLRCGQDHEFDGWFKDISTFDRQAKRGLVECPHCGDTDVSRALMTPGVPKKSSQLPTPVVTAPIVEAKPGRQKGGVKLPAEVKAMLQRLRAEVEKNCDYVGPEFAEEARKIHYGETAPRSIRGQASMQETRELLEEGIGVIPLPFPAKEDTH